MSAEKAPVYEFGFDPNNANTTWIRSEFSQINFGDLRLKKRFFTVAEDLFSAPLAPINQASGNWADAKGAYRFFDNEKIDCKAMLLPHVSATVRRAGASSVVLAVQDTVFVSYGTHPKTEGLGPIGKSNASTDQGLIMHNAVGFTTTGVPLGILSQNTWARPEVPDESKVEKIQRISETSLEEKESYKWVKALRETVEAFSSTDCKVVTLADREGDFFQFLAEADQLKANYVIRAKSNRKLETGTKYDTALEALTAAPRLGTLEIKIQGNGSRPGREAILEVKSVKISLPPPYHVEKHGDYSNPISTTMISATEIDPPEGQDAVSWVLMTNLDAKSFSAAKEKIEWYAKRWGIETWHKVIKSGCKVEDCRLGTVERLKRYLTMMSILAVRIMHLTYVSRLVTTAPANSVFTPGEIEAMFIRTHRKLPPPRRIVPVKEMVDMVCLLGGHLGRKSDGDGGPTVMWRGLVSLYETVDTLAALESMGKIK
jgi:hypothetical protein